MTEVKYENTKEKKTRNNKMKTITKEEDNHENTKENKTRNNK